MIAKTFKGGRTLKGAIATIKYLLDDRVEKGTAKLIRGDIEDTKALIKIAAKNKWSWSSGVLSFEESELDNKSIKEIMNAFEKTFFCGFDKSEYDISWIQHRDKDRVELHYIAPRLELRTGKAYNPYFVTRDFKKKNLFQKYINARYNLSAPEDNPQLTKQNRKQWAKNKKSLLAQIDDIVIEYIKDGLVESRDDIVYNLRELGLEIGGLEENHTYLTVIQENGKKARLKGLIYGRNYDYVGEKSKRAERESIERTRAEDRQNAQKFGAELNEYISRQAEYNNSRYKRKSDEEPRADESREQKIKQLSGENTQRGTTPNQNNPSPHIPSIGIDNRKPTNVPSDERIEADDRTRKEADRKLDTLRKEVRRVQEELQDIREQQQTISKKQQGINEHQHRIREQQQVVDRKIRIIREEIKELNMFKSEINLAEYISSFDYQRDKPNSSRNNIVMKKDDDKIIVSKSKESGHYVYFNVNDANDSGSIIDFIQKRFKENLGAVRNRLREWIKNPKPKEHIKITSSSKGVNKILNFWHKLKSEKFTEPYRGISAKILNSANKIKKVGNKLYFSLFNENGLCGVSTIDSNGDKMIIDGSEKGLWIKNDLKNAKRIIIFESPFDAMSYEQLKSQEDDFYVATLGNIGDSAKNTLEEMLYYNKDAHIVVNTDNDEVGVDLSNKIFKLIYDVDESVYTRTRLRARPTLKNWNEDLIEKNRVEAEKVQVHDNKSSVKHIPKEQPTQRVVNKASHPSR